MDFWLIKMRHKKQTEEDWGSMLFCILLYGSIARFLVVLLMGILE